MHGEADEGCRHCHEAGRHEEGGRKRQEEDAEQDRAEHGEDAHAEQLHHLVQGQRAPLYVHCVLAEALRVEFLVWQTEDRPYLVDRVLADHLLHLGDYYQFAEVCDYH